jgi:hypothetical protein
VQIIASPSRLFAALRDDPRSLRAILLLGITTLVLALLILKNPITGEPGPLLLDIYANFDESEMAPEQRATIERMMAGPLGYITSLTVPVAAVVSVFVVSLVLLIEIRLLRAFDPPVRGEPEGASRIERKRLLAVVAHASLIDLYELLFKVPLYFAKGSLNVFTSLAILLPEEASDSRLFKLLDAFDVFTAWKLALLTLGLSIVTSRTRRQSALLVIVPWVLWVAGTVVFHDVFSGMGEGHVH